MTFHAEQNVEALARADVYPDGEEAAPEVIQTHISVVVLTAERVYKFKKAIALPFLDFSTLEAREAACRDELRLNRRLAPETYLEVAPLRRDRDALRVGDGDGEVVDWCVVMRRLPADRMLDVLLENGAVDADEIDALARRVAAFHAEARAEVTAEARAAGAPANLLRALRDNFTELRDSAPAAVSPELLAAVERRTLDALPALRERLEQRAADGFVVEGHGDLHARNICMTDPPAIYDCLEFRLDFRAGDTATDLAFLTMDLRYRGRAELAQRAMEAYVAASGDEGARAVLPELVRYRAMVRAKVDALGSIDEGIDGQERARLARGARRHLRLAAWTRIEDDGPLVLLACGLPASGKSTVLLALADEAGWAVVRTDVVRKEMFGGGDLEAKLPDEAYSAEASRQVYAEVERRAAEAQGVVLVDANYRTFAQRERAAETARAAGKRVATVRFDCDDAVLRERLRERARGPSVSDADEAVLDRLWREYEPPEIGGAADVPGGAVFAVDGADAPEDTLDAIARALLAVR